ncbi:MAG: DUF4190 domain-containing protein [Solirubrobacteraceae bacterium]
MGTPPDKEGQEGEGWQPPRWRSEWQQPGDQPWQRPPEQPWQQAPDGRWMQVGVSQSSGKATAALVLGILGLVFCPLICSVLALVFGYQARGEIDASGGRIGGRGSAIAGIVLGWIGVVIVGLFMLLLIGGIAFGGGGADSSSPTDLPTV